MPLVSYRASVEAVLRWKRSDRVVPGLHEIHEVAGHRTSAKQLLSPAKVILRRVLLYDDFLTLGREQFGDDFLPVVGRG